MIKRILESIQIKCIFYLLFLTVFRANPVFAQNYDSVEVETYKLSLDFTKFKTQKITGIAKIRCKPLQGINPWNITFHLLKLKVDSVLYKSADSSTYRVVNFTHNDTLLILKVKIKGGADIVVYYQGTPIRDLQWGGFYFQGEYAYNMGVGFASNPHNYGRVWFPCIDNFTDKALYSYFIRVPRGYAAVCGGNFRDTVQNFDNTTTWHWEHINPIPTYLASVAVAPYKFIYSNYSGIKRNIPIILNAEAKDTSNLKKSFANLPKAMAAFEKFYGPYRFERVGYSLVPFDAGAMEHACNIAYPKLYTDGSLTFETLMAHELSHHWWGNNATCSEASDMWLNEGWASYSEALFTEFVYGKKAYQNYINNLHKSVLQFAHLADGAATGVNNVSHTNTYGRHVYKKGADMVHCIRGVMGDDLFIKKCQSLMDTFRMANFSTLDFSNHFNIPDHFVNQIISDTGFAHFSLYSANSIKESNTWKTDISYKQKKRFGHHVYENMPYEVFAFDKNFRKEVFKIKLGSDPFAITTKFKPEFICFDYDQKFSDAISDDVILTDSIGAHVFNYSMMTINIAQNKDTSLIRVEHNWVYPDAWFMNIPNMQISKERYWTVDGIFDPSLKATAILTYDGSKPANFSSGWLDNQLLEGRTEDSLILLYRPNAQSYWKIEANAVKTTGLSKNDKKGSFTLNELKKGEYAFGVKGILAGNGAIPSENHKLKIYPNPANETLKLEWANTLNPRYIEIFNSQGQKIVAMDVSKNSHVEVINTSHLTEGHYFVSLISNDLKRVSGEFVIER